MLSEIALSVNNITKCYQIYEKPHQRLWQMLLRDSKSFYTEHWALKGISFEIQQGETLGIIGTNGSGKSTLLQIICGTLNQTAGTVQTAGRVAALLELGAGFNPDFTGVENVRLSGQLYGMSHAEIDEKMASIIEFSGIGVHVHQPVKTYSSGMYVRLAFSVIAHLDPSILIVDEALSVGDFVFQQKCIRLMKEGLSNATKIVVSHDLATIAAMADRVLVLHQGNLAFLGDPQTAIAQYHRIARGSSEARSMSPSRQGLNDHPELATATAFSTQSQNDTPVDLATQSGTGNAYFTRVRWSVDGRAGDKSIARSERLCIDFELKVNSTISSPIIGYQMQNRNGVVVFGDNTHSSGFSQAAMSPGVYAGRIEILWPQIQRGDYGVTLGVGNGIESTSHVVECWAHNLLHLICTSTEPDHGIFNHPINSFSLDSN